MPPSCFRPLCHRLLRKQVLQLLHHVVHGLHKTSPVANKPVTAGVPSGESFPAAPLPVTRTDPTQNPNKFTAKPLQHRSVGASQDEQPQDNPHTSTQFQDSSPHPGRVPEEYGLPKDLAEIVANWDSLLDALKADILTKVREAVRE